MSPKVLNLILKAFDANGEAVFTRKDIAAWPQGAFDEAIRDGLLEKAAPADEVVCPGCERACHEDVEFIHGEKPADTRVYVPCPRWGRYAIPLASLDRWAVNVARASTLLPARAATQAPPSNTQGKVKRPKATAKQNAMLLLGALLSYHKFDLADPNWEPASSPELEAMLGWPQPRVSRAMKTLFGSGPMARYRRLCKEKVISGFLMKREDGTMHVEAIDPHSPMQ
jgi:hypothetical protein